MKTKKIANKRFERNERHIIQSATLVLCDLIKLKKGE